MAESLSVALETLAGFDPSTHTYVCKLLSLHANMTTQDRSTVAAHCKKLVYFKLLLALRKHRCRYAGGYQRGLPKEEPIPLKHVRIPV
jgi:hypothetical protein